jgi:hypothetical protein
LAVLEEVVTTQHVHARLGGPKGFVEVLDQSCTVGQRHHALYGRLVLDTRLGHRNGTGPRSAPVKNYFSPFLSHWRFLRE